MEWLGAGISMYPEGRMKTLILNGSPRKNGDTVSLIHIFLEGLEGEYKIVNAYEDGIGPCIDCRFCWENDGCSIQDGMQEVYEYIQVCDNILIVSPIYFSEIPCPALQFAALG